MDIRTLNFIKTLTRKDNKPDSVYRYTSIQDYSRPQPQAEYTLIDCSRHYQLEYHSPCIREGLPLHIAVYSTSGGLFTFDPLLDQYSLCGTGRARHFRYIAEPELLALLILGVMSRLSSSRLLEMRIPVFSCESVPQYRDNWRKSNLCSHDICVNIE